MSAPRPAGPERPSRGRHDAPRGAARAGRGRAGGARGGRARPGPDAHGLYDARVLRVGGVPRARLVAHQQREARRRRVGVRPDALDRCAGRRRHRHAPARVLRTCALRPAARLATSRADCLATARSPRVAAAALGPDPDPEEEKNFTDGSKPPPKQPVTWEARSGGSPNPGIAAGSWEEGGAGSRREGLSGARSVRFPSPPPLQFMLVRAGTIPPMMDSRDAFRKRFQGPGRRAQARRR